MDIKAVSVEQNHPAGILGCVSAPGLPDLVICIADLSLIVFLDSDFGQIIILVIRILDIFRICNCVIRHIHIIRKYEKTVLIFRLVIIIQMPFPGSAGHDEEFDLILSAEISAKYLTQIVGRKCAVRFKIGTAIV